MTTWVPIGPDFVFSPRDINFKRLSRRNEYARQSLVNSIAIDPNDANTIYTAETPASGGTAVFRTDDGGASWTSLMDSLQSLDPGNTNPSTVAHHASISGVIYVGTYTGRLYSSTTGGASWSTPFTFTGTNVFKIIADPRNANDPAQTTVYAALSNGIWMSTDGGGLFKHVLEGNCTAFAARIPTGGSSADFYAGLSSLGVFHTNDPTGTWVNLNGIAGSQLPAEGTIAQPSANFDAIRIDVCRLKSRVYAWFFDILRDSSGNPVTDSIGYVIEANASPNALFTAPDAASPWVAIPMTSPPSASYGLYDSGFAVAANSPGDGATDIIFFGGVHLSRSVDSGKTWTDMNSDAAHDDYHTFAFFPDPPPSGVMPITYIGCDGGLAMATGLADRSYNPPGSFNETDVVTTSGALQNLNHGKQSAAVYEYNSHPAIAALGYIGVQDTGMNAGDSSLMWRGLVDADGGPIACAQGTDGVKVWYTIDRGASMITDKGDFSPGVTGIRYGASDGPGVRGTSHFYVTPSNTCLGGINPQFPTTTVAAAIALGVQTVTPASMANIGKGTTLTIDPNGKTQEVVTVTNATATTFTATFVSTHNAGITVRIEFRALGIIDQNAIARAIGPDSGIVCVNNSAISPTNADLVCYSTTGPMKFYLSTNATSTSPTFTQITNSQPAGVISSITIDFQGNVYALMQFSVFSGGETGSGPLFLITETGWTQCNCTGLPADAINGISYSRLVADPVQAHTLYAGHDAAVFKLTSTSASGQFAWAEISVGLPGQWIYDLWVGNIGSTSAPKVLLRAAVPCRGIWECDVTKGAQDPDVELYLRDNVMDMGRLPKSPDGIKNPYNPSDVLFHHQCADIKIDALQISSDGSTSFFQTDPEGTLPLSHVLFDQLRDNSSNLPSADKAMVHVQVHNRGKKTLNNVSVWVIYCNASAGVPSLSASPSNSNKFPFWNQFQVNGTIVDSLPRDSPWRSVGPPQTLMSVDAAHPRVASWSWTVPMLSTNRPGHYCMVAFVNHSSSRLTASGFDVDVITPINRQIGQKNLHIGPPLARHSPRRRMLEYVEFHNPTPELREVTLVIDTRPLPSELRTLFALTRLDTTNPLPSSITGVRNPSGRPRGNRLGKWIIKLPSRILVCGTSATGGGDEDDQLGECADALTTWASCWHEAHEHPPQHGCYRPQPPLQFEPPIYEVLPSTRVEIAGVRLPLFGHVASLFAVEIQGTLPPGSEYVFHVQQLIGEEVVGGSTYIARIAGDRAQPVIEEQPEATGWIPPFALDKVAQSEMALGKIR
jgi:hypothetical protein